MGSVPIRRLLVCGDRNWSDRAYLWRTLDRFNFGVAIEALIEGEARGADTMAREWAEAHGIPVLPFPADWNKYHKAAGPIRNQQMLAEGQPDLVIAFHPDIAASRGTGDMVRRARAAGVEVIVYDGA